MSNKIKNGRMLTSRHVNTRDVFQCSNPVSYVELLIEIVAKHHLRFPFIQGVPAPGPGAPEPGLWSLEAGPEQPRPAAELSPQPPRSPRPRQRRKSGDGCVSGPV